MLPGRSLRSGLVGLVLIALVGGSLLIGSSRGVAQDETPDEPGDGRLASIIAGGCDEGDVGEVVASLTDLAAAAGDEVGQENAAGVAETSLTNVPLTLDGILADDHAVVAQLSTEEESGAIACGEIGGVLDENGDLVVGLREQNGSGFTGIAYLSDAGDGATTNVSLFVAQTGGDAVDADTAEAVATPGATPEADAGATPVVLAAPEEVEPQTVDVSLTEFDIDMETTLEAGPILFDVANDGTIRHNFEIEGEGVEASLAENLQPGESDTLEVELTPGTYTIYCPVGRHQDQGMELELTVE